MALVIGTVLALLSVAAAVYPFARRRLGWDKSDNAAADRAVGVETGEEADTAALADIYAAIRTLQLERELGSIPEELYREQLADYRIQAALALRRQEQAEGVPGMAAAAPGDEELEREIRAARAGLRRAEGDTDADPGREEGE